MERHLMSAEQRLQDILSRQHKTGIHPDQIPILREVLEASEKEKRDGEKQLKPVIKKEPLK